MAEKEGVAEAGPESGGLSIDTVATAMALASASSAAADEFLHAQRGLIADQRHHLHEQLQQLSLGLWEKRLGVWLRLATLFVGLAVAGGLALMV